MAKLTVEQRNQVRQWVKICRLRRLNIHQTTEFVNERLPPELALSLPAIEKYIMELRQEGRNWMFKMSVDVYEYADQIKEGWDCITELIRIQWEELDKARRNNDADTQAKASLLICKLNEQLLELTGIFPQIAMPPSMAKPIIGIADTSNGNGERYRPVALEESENVP